MAKTKGGAIVRGSRFKTPAKEIGTGSPAPAAAPVSSPAPTHRAIRQGTLDTFDGAAAKMRERLGGLAWSLSLREAERDRLAADLARANETIAARDKRIAELEAAAKPAV